LGWFQFKFGFFQSWGECVQFVFEPFGMHVKGFYWLRATSCRNMLKWKFGGEFNDGPRTHPRSALLCWNPNQNSCE
jgi:hypothetical protein